MVFALDLASLSRAPVDCAGRGLVQTGKDVLRCWPHEYSCIAENALWTGGLKESDWADATGRQGGTVFNCGYEPYALNYAFHALYPYIPTGVDRRDKQVLLFDARNSGAKMRNFHAALAYIKHYPMQTNAALKQTLGISHGVFTEQVVPTLYSLADHMSFLDFQLRLWEWNHTEFFLERITFAPDGFPINVRQPANRFLARLLRSGKYKDFVVKGQLTIALAPGFPIDYSGPHIGIRHDARMWKEDAGLLSRIKPWEYGLGDKGYVGCPQIITEWKGSNLTAQQLEFNLTVQHYRGRVEHLIAEMVQSRAALNTRWRGSFDLLAAIMKITSHMVGLQERMKGPKYDVFGPWPVCPARIAALHP